MEKKRITYQNWIVELGFDPSELPDPTNEATSDQLETADEIRIAVGNALENLTEEERECIIHYYYMGESSQYLSNQTGRSISRIVSLRKKGLKKMKKLLAPLVRRRYGLEFEPSVTCPICRSEHRTKIESLLKNKVKTDTYRPVIKILRKKYNIHISAPQILIGHEKYHAENGDVNESKQ